MVICNIQFLCLKSFVDTTLKCFGQLEKFKASDEGKAFLCNSTFLYFKTGQGRSTLENTLNLH